MDDIERASNYQATFLATSLDNISATVDRMNTPIGEGTRFCSDCDKQIPEARILAIPGALRCIHCQEKHDNDERSI